MPSVKNVSDTELEIAHLGRTFGPVPPGETVDVPQDAYDGLVGQTGVWEPAKAPAKKTAPKDSEVQA